jgi:hypothetical protein
MIYTYGVYATKHKIQRQRRTSKKNNQSIEYERKETKTTNQYRSENMQFSVTQATMTMIVQ